MTPRVFNLNLHGVGEPPRGVDRDEAQVWLSVDALHRALDAAAERSDVRLTFDDGNRSDLEHALPALVERRLTATFFPVADRLGSDGYLDAADLRTLVDAGMTVGSHGLTHADWRRLTDADLRHELRRSRTILEAATGRPVRDAACPFGSYDRRVLRAVRSDGGYARVYTSDGGAASANAWLQARTTLTRTHPSATEAVRPPRRPSPAPIVRGAKRLVKRWR